MGTRLIFALSLLVCACEREAGVRLNSAGLSGDGVQGVLLAGSRGCGEGGLQVGLWGPRWGTAGLVPARAVEEDGAIWVYFPLGTGLGEGEAAMRVSRGDATLLLGARPGEHEVHLQVGALPDDAPLDRAAAEGAARLAEEQLLWEQGSFLLRDGEQTVGDLQLLGDRALVAVYDAFWATPVPVRTVVRSEGPEIVLEFPVEPSLQGELGQLRLNVPTRSAVVPAEREPTELDRVLELVPGEQSSEAREALLEEATRLADQIESEQSGALARKLAAELRTPEGRCEGIEAVDSEWKLLLRGYQIDVVPDPQRGSCDVELSPTIFQHGRHLRGRFAPEAAP